MKQRKNKKKLGYKEHRKEGECYTRAPVLPAHVGLKVADFYPTNLRIGRGVSE